MSREVSLTTAQLNALSLICPKGQKKPSKLPFKSSMRTEGLWITIAFRMLVRSQTNLANLANFDMKVTIVATPARTTFGRKETRACGHAPKVQRLINRPRAGIAFAKKGYVETGTDSFGRRVCERQRECSKKTQPRIKAVKLPRGEAGDTVKVFGSWMKGPGMIVRCFFWSDKLGKFYTMYDEGTMDNAGVIYCNVPEKEAGVEDDVKIAVQVYHITTQATQLNECFSHGGSIPDKRGEFGKFRYEGGHCCDISEYHVWTKRNTCVWSCSKGTTPDKATPCGECVCKKDHVETGSDAFGRRVCERVFDCEKRTQPKIKSVYVPGNTASTGEEIKLKGSWRRGGNMEVKCNFLE